MTTNTDENKHCYLLIIDWFAKALGQGHFDKKPFYPIGRPHTFAIIILSKLGITRRLSKKYEFKFVCDEDSVFKKAEKNYNKGVKFSDVLETFIELSVYYGSAQTRVNYPFPIHKDVEDLFIELEKMGLAKRVGFGFQWTKKLAPIMKAIYNYEFLEPYKITSKEIKAQKTFKYLG